MSKKHQICTKCVCDSSIPEIKFNKSGVCNYCYQFNLIIKDIEKDNIKGDYLNNLITKIKSEKVKKYNVLIGVSGGVDSMYLIDYASKMGLKILAVNFDNGWHSEIAVSNIKKCLKILNVDFQAYVVDYEEMKDILVSYMKAGMPWIDFPTDNAINAVLYKIANEHKIKYIFNGSSIRTEGKQPLEWTYSDSRQLKYIVKRFGQRKLKTFPLMSPKMLLYYSLYKKIKVIRPLNYIEYDKEKAKKMLVEKYKWKDYGGHHHESAFTKFAIAYWLPKKFKIDKRKITFSAQIRSGFLERNKAIKFLSKLPYKESLMERDKKYVIKKLNISEDTFNYMWEKQNQNLYSYPSYILILKRFHKTVAYLLNKVFPFKALISYQLKNHFSDEENDL